MQDWNPARYLQFEAERTRPAAELAARSQHPSAHSSVRKAQRLPTEPP